MKTRKVAVTRSSKPEIRPQSFEDHLGGFRQGLINQKYAAGTVYAHVRCVNVLAKAMKAIALTLEELDEAQALVLIANTGWMRDRVSYRALMVKRLFDFWLNKVSRGLPNHQAPGSWHGKNCIAITLSTYAANAVSARERFHVRGTLPRNF
jgi:hypothetical protein